VTTSRVLGVVVLLTCSLSATEGFAQASKSDGTLGQRAYKAVCMGCHSVEPGVTKTGPTLSGLLGRKAGSMSGSDALRRSGLVWDRDSLNRYLHDPVKAVPGTTMVVRMEDAEVREALVDYLLTLK
jgi:cytochrome c